MTDAKKAAAKAVQGIVADLSDRRGLRHEWERIDAEIRREIVAEWRGIVEKAIAEVGK